jgi:hypothetical protein
MKQMIDGELLRPLRFRLRALREKCLGTPLANRTHFLQ